MKYTYHNANQLPVEKTGDNKHHMTLSACYLVDVFRCLLIVLLSLSCVLSVVCLLCSTLVYLIIYLSSWYVSNNNNDNNSYTKHKLLKSVMKLITLGNKTIESEKLMSGSPFFRLAEFTKSTVVWNSKVHP